MILWTVPSQASLSMGFPRQEYWSGLLFLPPGHLPNPGFEPRSLTLWADSLPSEPPEAPVITDLVGFYSTIHELGSIWTSRQTGALKNCRRWFFSCSVMSESLWPHGLQYARLPCPSLSLGVCPSSCPLNWWSRPTISSSAAPSPFVFSLSQHQGFSQWVGFLHQVAKVLELPHQSFQWIFRVDFL